MCDNDGWQQLKETLASALKQLFEDDQELLSRDVNERTLSFRLAHYLTPLYPDHDVDCEYNRHGDAIKRLPAPDPALTNDTKGKTIFPDILVHERGNDENNHILIEIKKSDNTDTARDIEKLRSLTAPGRGYFYQYGLHLTFGENRLSGATVYTGGNINENKTRDFIEYFQESGLLL